MAVVDEALRRFGFIDPERLGVIGGSYGGYMTSWIVSHTDRFKAAVSERAVNSFVSMWGSSDFGWDMKGYFGSFLYEDVETYLRLSPLTYAENIHTPLLILHSENDLRCPVEQGEQLFVTLRQLKRPVEIVRFPAESHELTRSGSPRHRVQRFELVLAWSTATSRADEPADHPSVVHRFVPTRVQTSILRGADLLGGDVVEGDEKYLYLFRRADEAARPTSE